MSGVISSWKKRQTSREQCKEEITELIKSEESDPEVKKIIFDYQKICTDKSQTTAVLLTEIRQMINDQKVHAKLDRINFWNDSIAAKVSFMGRLKKRKLELLSRDENALRQGRTAQWARHDAEFAKLIASEPDTMVKEVIKKYILAAGEARTCSGERLVGMITTHFIELSRHDQPQRLIRWNQLLGKQLARFRERKTCTKKQPSKCRTEYLVFAKKYMNDNFAPEEAQRLYGLCPNRGRSCPEIESLDQELLQRFLICHPEFKDMEPANGKWRPFGVKELLCWRGKVKADGIGSVGLNHLADVALADGRGENGADSAGRGENGADSAGRGENGADSAGRGENGAGRPDPEDRETYAEGSAGGASLGTEGRPEDEGVSPQSTSVGEGAHMHLPYAAAAPLSKGAETEQISCRAEGGLGELGPEDDDTDLDLEGMRGAGGAADNFFSDDVSAAEFQVGWGAGGATHNFLPDDVSAAEFQVGCHEH
jgi:hypothetical protein